MTLDTHTTLSLGRHTPNIDRGQFYSYTISMVTSERVRRRQAETRHRIFQCAMELFTSQGFTQTTVAQITEAADIGKGTFFTYFESKDAIFDYLSEEVTGIFEKGLAEDLATGFDDALTQTFTQLEEWFAQNSTAAQQMCLAQLQVFWSKTRHPHRSHLLQIIRSFVERALEKQQIPQQDPTVLSNMIVGTYFIPVAAWATTRNPSHQSDIHPQFIEHLRLILSGVHNTTWNHGTSHA